MQGHAKLRCYVFVYRYPSINACCRSALREVRGQRAGEFSSLSFHIVLAKVAQRRVRGCASRTTITAGIAECLTASISPKTARRPEVGRTACRSTKSIRSIASRQAKPCACSAISQPGRILRTSVAVLPTSFHLLIAVSLGKLWPSRWKRPSGENAMSQVRPGTF